MLAPLLRPAGDLFRKTFFYSAILGWRNRKTIRRWMAQGKPSPPPHAVKQEVLRKYGQMYSLQILVETGTYQGDMVQACKRRFKRILSIELDPALCEAARKKFSRDPHVSIHQGDSAKILPELLAELSDPGLFWLDGHYSGGVTAQGDLSTPVIQEVEAILHHEVGDHVILIDDAREFTGRGDYPTIPELKARVLGTHPSRGFTVEDDIIRITPGRHGADGSARASR